MDGNGSTQASIQDLRELNRRLEDRVNRKLDDLEEHITEKLEEIQKTQLDHAIQLAELRVKSGVWGGLSGLAAAVAALIAYVVGK